MDVYLKVTIGPNSRYAEVVELDSGVPGEALFAYATDHRSNNLVDGYTVARVVADTMGTRHFDDLWRVVAVEPVERG